MRSVRADKLLVTTRHCIPNGKRHLLEEHQPDVAVALGELFAHIVRFEPYFKQAMFDPTVDIFDVIADQPDRQTRQDFAQMWFGSAMDVIRPFLGPGTGRTIQGSLAAMAIDGFDGGPWTPGSSVSMLYHYMLRSPGDANGRIIMPRGGIGSLSAALKRRAEALGAEVRLNTGVKSLMLDGNTVTGVVLRDEARAGTHGGTQVTADVVLSSLDPRTTFLDLVGEQHFPGDYIRKLKEINHNLGYIQAHMTIEGEPEWIERLQPFIHDAGHTCPTIAYLPSAEYVADAWDEYRAGKVPSAPLAYLYLPSMVDKSLAPEGHHSATIYAPYFPQDLEPDEHRQQKERFADACIATLDRYSPGFSERIGERVVLSDRYFNSAFSAHRGDFAHGTLAPWQLWTKRMVPDEAKYATPIHNLYMCGQGTHPGPGVTSLPGWNGGSAALERLNARSTTASM